MMYCQTAGFFPNYILCWFSIPKVFAIQNSCVQTCGKFLTKVDLPKMRAKNSLPSAGKNLDLLGFGEGEEIGNTKLERASKSWIDI